MKKTVAAVILIGLISLACSQYTCPTYSKSLKKAPATTEKNA